MDNKTVSKIERLELLSDELSGELQGRLRVIHSLMRDAQLNLETLSKITDIQNGYDSIKLQGRAHEFSEKIQKELANKEPDIGSVLSLLLTKSILLDPTNPSLKSLGDIVKSMGSMTIPSPREDVVV
jgi:hypothetical protein